MGYEREIYPAIGAGGGGATITGGGEGEGGGGGGGGFTIGGPLVATLL